jgi:polyvinyl alcohol dehydrogenase (cytochrome)
MRLATLLLLSAAAWGQAPCPGSAFAGSWNGWGASTTNTRFQPTTSINAGNLAQLEVKWAFGLEGERSAFGQPAIANGRVFVGADTGQIYALNAETGCVHWTYKADAGVRTAITIATIGPQNRAMAFFGDVRGKTYGVDAATGRELWKAQVESHPAAKLTGAPVVFEERVYVPVASGEEGASNGPTYACCTFRGSVVALAAGSGRELWKTYVIPDEPKQRGAKANGTPLMGPSGAGIWSAPTIDAKRRQLYVTTGDAYSSPAAAATDAVLALDLDTGVVKWIQQDTADDIWTTACMGASKPADCGPDHDFGSPAILISIDGRDLLIAGQKSGNVWAHDPDTGKVLWRTPLVADTTQFGGKIVWGGSTDAQRAYFGLGSGGVAAVQLRDGEKQWFTNPPLAEGMQTHPGHEGPVTSIPGVVFSGGFDGMLRALSSSDGKVLWEFNTARAFQTTNGVQAKGGSLGAPGPVVAGDRLFVHSGYVGVKNGVPGNVLLSLGLK